MLTFWLFYRFGADPLDVSPFLRLRTPLLVYPLFMVLFFRRGVQLMAPETLFLVLSL